jgi:polar amino acid transport system substrate-binding protein
MSSFISRCVAVIGVTLALISHASAQDETQTVNAVAGIVPPFVMQQDGKLTGFSIDLWNEIASRLKLTTNFQVTSDIDTFVEALRSKKVTVAVSGVYYTTERDREFDFSYPILEAGLQVMVRDTGEGVSATPLKDVIALLFSRSALMWLAVAGLIIIVPAHLMWLLDRGNEEGVSPGKPYWPNILHALTFATTALVSQVQLLPRQWLARIIGLLWMFAGVVFIALYTAQLTATLTVEQIRGAINGPGDLPGKKVATLAHSPAATYLQSINAQTQEFQSFEEMYQALLDQKADAVLMASPPLRYFAAHEGKGRVKLVGPEFRKQNLGFVFQLGDPLRRRVSSVLLALREDGTYERLYDKWFGSETE